MKNPLQKLVGTLFVAILLSSCSTVRVTFPSKKSENVDKVAILTTYVDIIKPVIPLVNAAITNKRVNSISTELIPLFEENATKFRDELAKLLKDQLNCEVIFGEALQNNPGFKEIKEIYNFDATLNRNDEYFPEIAISKNDINPFEFKKGKVGNYFAGKGSGIEKPYSATIISICKRLDINYIVVSNSTILIGAGDLLTRDKMCLFTGFYIFNKAGECIATGSNFSKLAPTKTDEVESYQIELDKYSEILLPIVEKIAANFKN